MSLGPRKRPGPRADESPHSRRRAETFPEPPCTPHLPGDPPPFRLPDGFCTTEPDGGLLRLLRGVIRPKR